MSFKIITISREFGSGGRFIGEQIAQKCGIEFYDKKIIEHVAKELGISEQIVANQGEYAPAGSIFHMHLWGATSQEFLFQTRFSISSRSSSRILRKKSHALLWDVAQTTFFLTGMMC